MNSIDSEIDKAWLTFLCPLCGLENDYRVQQATLEERIHCRGCHETIQLVDRNASTVTTKRHIHSALDELQKALRNFR